MGVCRLFSSDRDNKLIKGEIFMGYKYCTATSWGKGFLTYNEKRQFFSTSAPGNIWITDDSIYAGQWIDKVNGVAKSKAAAQAIVDAAMEDSQATHDSWSVEEQAKYPRPVKFEIL